MLNFHADLHPAARRHPAQGNSAIAGLFASARKILLAYGETVIVMLDGWPLARIIGLIQARLSGDLIIRQIHSGRFRIRPVLT